MLEIIISKVGDRALFVGGIIHDLVVEGWHFILTQAELTWETD